MSFDWTTASASAQTINSNIFHNSGSKLWETVKAARPIQATRLTITPIWVSNNAIANLQNSIGFSNVAMQRSSETTTRLPFRTVFLNAVSDMKNIREAHTVDKHGSGRLSSLWHGIDERAKALYAGVSETLASIRQLPEAANKASSAFQASASKLLENKLLRLSGNSIGELSKTYSDVKKIAGAVDKHIGKSGITSGLEVADIGTFAVAQIVEEGYHVWKKEDRTNADILKATGNVIVGTSSMTAVYWGSIKVGAAVGGLTFGPIGSAVGVGCCLAGFWILPSRLKKAMPWNETVTSEVQDIK